MNDRRSRRSRRESSRSRPVRTAGGAILEAAVQVLASEGARRFTTARVAERAGVSVGSLYQYFPNKEAILFRLQSDEWRRRRRAPARHSGDRSRPPFERLRALVHAFFRSECEEAELRVALSDAAPLYPRRAEITAGTRKAGAPTRCWRSCARHCRDNKAG